MRHASVNSDYILCQTLARIMWEYIVAFGMLAYMPVDLEEKVRKEIEKL